MPSSGYHHRGINEVGEVQSGPTDVSWGKTQQAGVVLQMSGDTADLQSGQSKVMEESEVISVDLQLQFNLLDTALQTVQRAYGIPSSKFGGDIPGSTTNETLDLDGEVGSVEKTIYAIGPGPGSTRRMEAPRAKIVDLGDITMAHDDYAQPQVTWRALVPDSGAPVQITDAV